MQCPKCFADIKFRERSNNVCSKCFAAFAFEPKSHPLQLTDKYFSKTVANLSSSDKLFFTPQQLQFAVSRKKLKSNSAIAPLIVAAVMTTVFFIFIYPLAAAAIAFLWIIIIIAKTIYYRKYIFLPQTIVEFHNTVLEPWRLVYKKYPSKLILDNKLPQSFNDNVSGILICDDSEIAMCLAANNIDKNLNLAIAGNPNQIAELLQKQSKPPIFLMHGASIEGYSFAEKIKRQFGAETRVFDIGLRPRMMMKSRAAKLRQKSSETASFSGLTKEEIEWLKQGYYSPLFVLKTGEIDFNGYKKNGKTTET